MIKSENFPNAYKEVYVILNYIEEESVKKIPPEFINMLKEKMNENHEFNYDERINFEEQKILQETKVVLAYIFLNYWGTKEQNDRIMKKFNDDIKKEEQSKPKYNPDELFKKNKQIQTNTEIQIIEHKKENIFLRMLNKIRNLLIRKK